MTDEAMNIVMGDEEESELLGFLGGEDGFLEDADLEGLAEGVQEGLADGLEGIGLEDLAEGVEDFDIGETFDGVGETVGEVFEGFDEGVDMEECCACCGDILAGGFE